MVPNSMHLGFRKNTTFNVLWSNSSDKVGVLSNLTASYEVMLQVEFSPSDHVSRCHLTQLIVDVLNRLNSLR